MEKPQYHHPNNMLEKIYIFIYFKNISDGIIVESMLQNDPHTYIEISDFLKIQTCTSWWLHTLSLDLDLGRVEYIHG